MLSIRTALHVLALPALLLLGLATTAQAQALDDTWFKVKATTKGVTIHEDGTIKQQEGASTHYVHLTWTDASYAMQVWSEVDKDVWQLASSTGSQVEAGNPHCVFTDVEITFGGEEGRWVAGFLTACIYVKLDKQGHLKNATFKTLGGEAVDGTLDGEHEYRGSLRVTGKLAKPEQLPFTPKS